MGVDFQSTIEQVKAGQRNAFAVLVSHYQRPLFAYLGRLGLAQAAAEDIAQEAFLRAWRNIRRFDPTRASFTTWLFTIARNLAWDERAKPQHRHETGEGENWLNHPGAEPSTPENLIKRETHQRLNAALNGLKPEDRRALALAYVEGLSMAEAASIEQCREGAFKTRLHRARTRLRQIMENDHAA